MEQNVRTLMSKVRSSAELIGDKTGKAYKLAADNAGKKAADMLTSTKLNLKILEANSEIDQLYQEIGRMVYDAHQGIESDSEELDTKLALIDEKNGEIADLRARLRSLKAESICPNCGRECRHSDTFCRHCGAQL